MSVFQEPDGSPLKTVVKKILMIRMSSFGDVVQCLSVADRLSENGQNEVHWLTKSDFRSLIANHPRVNHIWTLTPGMGLKRKMELIKKLRAQSFTHVYDAHNTFQSRLFYFFICFLSHFSISRRHPTRGLTRPRNPIKRFLLFVGRVNLFERPFSAQRDLLKPLADWNLPIALPPVPQIFVPAQELAFEDFLQKIERERVVALCPSAAHALKRWPQNFWESLIEMFPAQRFFLLGGPSDHFISSIQKKFPDRVGEDRTNLSFSQSAAVLSKCIAVVTNDTGLLHVAEQFGKPTIALMGPAPFGYPSRPSTQILELELYCKPCSKHGQGPCYNPEYQKCLRSILPESVRDRLRGILGGEGC